jgi:hypothetical protein
MISQQQAAFNPIYALESRFSCLDCLYFRILFKDLRFKALS